MVAHILTLLAALVVATLPTLRRSPWLMLMLLVAAGMAPPSAIAGTIDQAARAAAGAARPFTANGGGGMLPPGTADSVMRRLWPQPHPYMHDFEGWCRTRLGVQLLDYQREIGESVTANRLTAVPSCHGAGKSFEAALLIAWWLDTRPLDQVFVVWTAPTFPQVRAVVGRYLQAILPQLDNGIRILDNMEVKGPGGILLGFGRKPADTNTQAFSGIHADHVLIVVDEATGVRDTIWRSVRSFMSVGTCRLLAIGNPDDPSSYFQKTVHNPKLHYNVVRIDGLRLPSMTREAVAPYPRLAAYMEAEGVEYAEPDAPATAVSRITQPMQWAEWLDEWGPDNPYWKSKVRGEFPDISERALFTPAMLQRALENEIEPDATVDGWFAFDISEEGGDETVGYHNRMGRIRCVYEARLQDPMQTVGAIAEILDEHVKTVPAWIDANAVGAGVWSRLNERGYPVVKHKGSFKALDSDYFNRRAEVYYNLKRMFEDDEIDLDPADITLRAQLLDIRWKYHSGGKHQLETRDEQKRRGMNSPDRADAVAMVASAPGTFTKAMLLREQEERRKNPSRGPADGMLGVQW